MKQFTITLNLVLDAHDSEEALDIAKACKAILEGYKNSYKVQVDIDVVEEL